MDDPITDYRFVAEEKAERVDSWLSDKLDDVSRNRIKDLVRKGHATLNGRKVKPSASVQAGDIIEVAIPTPAASPIEAENIPLDVLFEDAHMIAVNKTAGLVVHPARGNETGTLVNALLHHCEDLAGVGGEERPGIVHRLDKDTSGVIIAAKTDLAHRRLQDQFRERTINKQYLAVVLGVPDPKKQTINAPLDRHPHHRVKRAIVEHGREAITHFTVAKDLASHALLEVKIDTGRTHQIRVHLASIGHPVIGDTLYGGKQPGFDAPRQLLHAHSLGCVHPDSGEAIEFVAPPPPEFGVLTD